MRIYSVCEDPYFPYPCHSQAFYHLLTSLQLLEPTQDWHTTSVEGKGFFTNEPGTQTMCSTFGYKEQDGEIDTSSGTEPCCHYGLGGRYRRGLSSQILLELGGRNRNPMTWETGNPSN